VLNVFVGGGATEWRQTFLGHSGVWRLDDDDGDPGSLQFFIPNANMPDQGKEIRIQVTYFDVSGPPVAEFLEPYTDLSSFAGTLSDGWKFLGCRFRGSVCGAGETLTIKPPATLGSVVYIDQVVIDTFCKPANATGLRYTFDQPGDSGGQITDRSGNGLTGTVIDPSDAQFVSGHLFNSTAIHFTKDDTPFPNGSGIDTGTDTTTLGIDTGPFTIMAWVNLDGLRGRNMVFGTTSNPALQCGFIDQYVYMGFGFGQNESFALGVPAGEWHHCAWRYDPAAGNQEIFIDGELVSSDPGHSAYGRAQTLLIGRALPGDGAFGGSLDDVRVYGLALRNDQIAAIANDQPIPP
jgi:hypothetical protein